MTYHSLTRAANGGSSGRPPLTWHGRIFPEVLLILSIAIVLLISSGCTQEEPSASTEGGGVSQKASVKIGAILPLTGDIAEYGRRCRDGIDLAVEHVNGSGGIAGGPIEVIYEDSRGLPRDGVSAIQKLINVDRVAVIVGAVSSSVTLAVEPIATRNKVILFSPASSSPKLTGISQYFFRNWPSDVYEATVLAEFVRSTLDLESVAVLYVNNDYGIGLKDEFARRFAELGGAINVSETYAQSATDFRTQLAKIKATTPEGIYLAGYHREMALATKQIRELGIPAQILGDADYGVEELLDIAGSAAEGAIYSMPEYDSEAGSDAVLAFSAAFKKRYGRSPSIFEANAYDAIRILCEAIEACDVNTDCIAEHIASLSSYQGASGDISFGESREVIKPVTIKTVRNGQFVSYEHGN